MSHHKPLIKLEGVCRSYESAGGTVHALVNVNLSIQAGEMVAIMGPSGSGKSTLMNLLGCLDVPSSGVLSVAGEPVAGLNPDALAALRRERFGFIFQRYHLLGSQNALKNVEMPAIYAGLDRVARLARASKLLKRLGLGDRHSHHPSALSGGQQQRVSIARALMNGGEIILADEPTGALDSQSGRSMMALLKKLHEQGHTVILITHDAAVAAQAPRLIELHDGHVVRDSGWPSHMSRHAFVPPPQPRSGWWANWRRRVEQSREAVLMALGSLKAHRLRTALSMLGISIGIAAVVSIVATGDAMRASLDNTLRGLLSKRMTLNVGSPNLKPGIAAKMFQDADVVALQKLEGVKGIRPKLETMQTVRHNNKNQQVSVVGLSADDLEREGLRVQLGRGFSSLDEDLRSQVLVLTPIAANYLFEPGAEVLGQTVLVAGLPFVVVGVTGEATGGNAGNDWQTRVFVPSSTFRTKVSAGTGINQLQVDMTETAEPEYLMADITRVLTLQHGLEDFTVFNMDRSYQEVNTTQKLVQLVLVAIASISLLVGGVGVMNIMLVSVSERMPEIGIRMAVGARQSDVQTQFLIESIVLCCAGGLLGLALSYLAASGINFLKPDLVISISWSAMSLAFMVSSAIGLVFGLWPARQASRLSPVVALARE